MHTLEWGVGAEAGMLKWIKIVRVTLSGYYVRIFTAFFAVRKKRMYRIYSQITQGRSLECTYLYKLNLITPKLYQIPLFLQRI